MNLVLAFVFLFVKARNGTNKANHTTKLNTFIGWEGEQEKISFERFMELTRIRREKEAEAAALNRDPSDKNQ